MSDGRTVGRSDGRKAGRFGSGVVAGLFLSLLPILQVSLAHAQSDPRVIAAVRQAQEGSGDSARAALSRLLGATQRTDPLYAEVLYASALVAPTALEMQRNLQQVTVEHPLSRWADDALLKLAQLEYAGGNLPGAVRQLERIRSDFPQSDILGWAAFWGARTHFDLRDERSACRWVGIGLAATPASSPEVRAQLDGFARRCPGDLLASGALAAQQRPAAEAAPAPVVITPAPAESTPAPADPAPPAVAAADTSAPAPAPADTIRLPAPETSPGALVARIEPSGAAPPAQPAPAFRVQVVAATAQPAADAAVQRLERLGFSARIVREGAFLKVRAGGWPSRAEAGQARARLLADFPGAFVVED
ncbi:MAG TPA: SPOR domain-containing protein [Gemmatimonadales bacterium]|nr:SPOR domain-containing protein [Gemmatimonadales bacterium]